MNPRKVLRIARWEVSRNAGTVNRATVALVVVGAALGLLAGPAVVGQGVDFDRGIYTVGLDDDSPYSAVVERNSQFVAANASVEDPKTDAVDLVVRGDQVYYAPDDEKSRAAYDEFRAAVQRYNDYLMRQERNESAAFPVNVSLEYRSRTIGGIGGTGPVSSDGGDGTGAGGGSGDDGGGSDADGGGDGDGDGGGDDAGGGAFGAPDVGGAGLLGGDTRGAPGDIQPPFPFGSLVLAFVFVVPMNFVIQAYGSSIMEERLNRRGELMLVSPVTRGDIVAGKTLPYFLVLAVVTALIAVAVGGSWLSVAAVLPIALLFLATAFVAGMFARSFKELSFVTVALSVFLTSYVFLPAIFTEVTPIALISPLTLVVRDLSGSGASLVEYGFSTGPFLLSALVLFTLGAGVYREEDMFTQRAIPHKVLDAVVSQVRGRRSVFVLSVAFMPFVIVAELIVVAATFPLSGAITGNPLLNWVGLVLLFVAIAVVEELAKSVHVYAGFAHAQFDRTTGVAIVLGALAGAGFFVGEKLVLVAQLVGLQDYVVGQAAFGVGSGAGAGAFGPVVAGGLLLAPLLLHAVTATISAVGASRGRAGWGAGLAVAAVVHVIYNLAVLTLVYGPGVTGGGV
ncbi:MAG: ABC-type Na+ efflux pump permease subunit [Halobacteriales archaeon]